MRILLTLLITLVVFLVVDFLWLGVIAKDFYKGQLGHVFSSGFKLWPALIFYPLYALGVVVLVVQPALNQGYSLGRTFLLGALLGLMSYGAYNLTNLMTIENWPLKAVLVDMSWGGFVTGLSSLVSYYLSNIWLS